MKQAFKNKTVLVTGGTGSIGSEIVRQVLALGPKQVRVFSRDESKQFALQHEIPDQRLRFFIGDVRDKERLLLAMQGSDIVYHAAAMKHVPACEYNPFEALKTNVLGTQNIIESCLATNVEKAVLISTDKAANPTSIMGTTKLLAEKLFINANYYKGARNQVYSVVRFGNVMGTRGSVIPLFIEQGNNGGPLTITSSEMTRFMMSVDEAVALVIKATMMIEPSPQAGPGNIFILKMPCIRIKDLAEAIRDEIAKRRHVPPSSIPIKTVGLRSGEKLHEDLITQEEALFAQETDGMIVVRQGTCLPHQDIPDVAAKKPITLADSSEAPLSKDALLALLKKNKFL